MNIEIALKILAESSDVSEKTLAVDYIFERTNFEESSLKAIANLLKDSDRGLKDYAARILSELKEPQSKIASGIIAPFILEDNIELRNLAGDILVRIGSDSAEYLLSYLTNDDPDVRKFACDILGLLNSREFANNIVPLLDDSDINCVQSAIEALGNYQYESAIDKLLTIYESDPEQKPMIIDALAKIGTERSQDQLLEFLSNEKDVFLKTAIIDALSLHCDDIEIANKLFATIENSQETLQIIILKTVSAIAFRLGELLVLPDNLRHIAYKAMFDDDSDIRSAGILSLGNIYILDDFPSIMNEIFKGTPDTQSLVLERLLYYNEPAIIQAFFKSFCNEVSSRSLVSCDIDFLSLLSYMWKDVSQRNKNATIGIIIEMLLKKCSQEIETTLELLLKLDKQETIKQLFSYKDCDDEYVSQVVSDILSKLSID